MDICFWNKCNNRCLICTNPQDFWEDDLYTSDFLKKRLLDLRQQLSRGESILLTGGEPTIHPEFLETLFFVRQKYPTNRIDLLSNGRRFFYPEFTRRVLSVNNIDIAVPLHGHDATSHDKVTQVKGSFNQSKEGLRNLLNYKQNKRNQNIELRIIINRINYKQIDKILKLAIVEFPQIDRVTLIFFEIEGLGKDNFKKAGLTYREFKPFFRKITPLFKKFKEIRLYHFPLCVIDRQLWPHCWITLPDEDITHVKACQKCLLRRQCLGVPKTYFNHVGDQEFTAITKKPRLTLGKNKHHPIIDTEQ